MEVSTSRYTNDAEWNCIVSVGAVVWPVLVIPRGQQYGRNGSGAEMRQMLSFNGFDFQFLWYFRLSWNCNWNRWMMSDMSIEEDYRLLPPSNVNDQITSRWSEFAICMDCMECTKHIWCLLVLHGDTIWNSIVIEWIGHLQYHCMIQICPKCKRHCVSKCCWVSWTEPCVARCLCLLDESHVTLDYLLNVWNDESCSVVLMYHFVHVR